MMIALITIMMTLITMVMILIKNVDDDTSDGPKVDGKATAEIIS